MRKERLIIRDQTAVAEEFTSLPVIMVIVIGLTLFFLLIAQSYHVYEQTTAQIKQIEKAKYLANKLVSPNNYFINSGGMIDIIKIGCG